jgi:hypothetical protein
LERIDSFLIDRVFQPATDLLAPLVSCYALAEFAATGGLLAHTVQRAFVAITASPIELVFFLFELSWVLPIIVRARSLDRQPPSNVLPIERVSRRPLRVCLLVTSSPFLPLFVLAPGPNGLIAGGWWLLLLATYLLACRRMPPSQKRAREPWFGWFSAVPATGNGG